MADTFVVLTRDSSELVMHEPCVDTDSGEVGGALLGLTSVVLSPTDHARDAEALILAAKPSVWVSMTYLDRCQLDVQLNRVFAEAVLARLPHVALSYLVRRLAPLSAGGHRAIAHMRAAEGHIFVASTMGEARHYVRGVIYAHMALCDSHALAGSAEVRNRASELVVTSMVALSTRPQISLHGSLLDAQAEALAACGRLLPIPHAARLESDFLATAPVGVVCGYRMAMSYAAVGNHADARCFIERYAIPFAAGGPVASHAFIRAVLASILLQQCVASRNSSAAFGVVDQVEVLFSVTEPVSRDPTLSDLRSWGHYISASARQHIGQI